MGKGRVRLIIENKFMRIEIGIGLGNLTFGMSQEKVISIMGKPDKIVQTEPLQDFDYYFNNYLIKIKFDSAENYRLYAIEVFNTKIFMFNQQLINKDKDEILALLKSNGYCDVKQEDYELFETIFCEEIWSEFIFKFNKLRSISFSPLFDNDDEIIWPIEKEDSVHSRLSLENLQNQACHMLLGSPKGINRPIQIKIGIGLDNIIFGIFQDDVINLLGKPDKILDTEKEDGIVYYYNNLMVKTKFDLLEGGRLYSFEIYNPNAIMFNQQIIYKEKSEVLELLKMKGYSDVVHKDYETFDTIFCKEMCSTFAFEFDKLINVEFSPLYDKNGKTLDSLDDYGQ